MASFPIVCEPGEFAAICRLRVENDAKAQPKMQYDGSSIAAVALKNLLPIGKLRLFGELTPLYSTQNAFNNRLIG